jgi:hypothetical protein
VGAGLVGLDCREALVFRRGLVLMVHCQGAVWYKRLVVGERLRRWRRDVVITAVLVCSTLGLWDLVTARRALREGTPTSGRPAMVVVVHGVGGRV